MRAYRIANRDRRRILDKRVRDANPERFREIGRRTAARMSQEAKERKRARARDYAKKRYQRLGEVRSPQKVRADRALYRQRHKEKLRIKSAEYHRKNAERINASAIIRRSLNRDRVKATIARWKAAHPDKHTEYQARRRAARLHACPVWADRNEIKIIYAKARELGLTVDHVIPLQGKTVSGLHVPDNLQLLERRANISKSNKFTPITIGEFL